MRNSYFQPKLGGHNWGETYQIDRSLNHQGDVFLGFVKDSEPFARMPIKYSLEAQLNNYLGIIACLSGKINGRYYLRELSRLSEDGRVLSDEDRCQSTASIWLDKGSPRDVYEGYLLTYQGNVTARYVPEDPYFSLIHTDRADSGWENNLPLDLSMIPVITDAVSADLDGVGSEYFSVARKIHGIIAAAWSDN